jgi:uncharacterized protein DUF4476
MKIKITLLFLLLTGISFAQFGGPIGHLTVFSESGDKFYLILNGEQQNDIPQTNLRIEDLNQPYYEGKIIFLDKNLQEISKSYIAMTDADGIFQDVTYKIKKDKNNKSKMKMNFFSMIPVRQGYVAPSNVYVVHHGQPQPNTIGLNTSVNVGVNVNMNVNVNDPHAGHDHAGHDRSENNSHNSVPKNCANRFEMLASDFSQALASVKKQAFEDVRLNTAKQITAANCVSTNQIAQLCKAFSFEDNKLDLAKFAYDFCTDRKNYFKLNDMFAFSSNSDALSEYIQSKN